MSEMLTTRTQGTMAWRAHDLRDEDWKVEVSPAVLSELDRVLARVARSPLPLAALEPQTMELDATRKLMSDVRTRLATGRGFVLMDRLPVADWGPEASTTAYWLLSSLVARPVAQDIGGRLVYDVQDSGKKTGPGTGVRPALTNVEQYFHNDNGYNQTQPEHVGLLCLQPALTGGVSGVASIQTIHNELLARSPQLLQRLYGSYRCDRQNERHPDEPEFFEAPIFTYQDGVLRGRISLMPIFNAYEMAGPPLDDAGRQALELLKQVLAEPSICHSFTMTAGQMQFVNNVETCHRRSGFTDDPTRRRRLVRLWLRDHGWRGY